MDVEKYFYMVAVILLCGCPGTGKSSVATAISALLQDSRVLHFDDFEVDKADWTEGTFKLSRKAALSEFSNYLGHGNEYIIIDDIMYLRSMRHQIYTLTQQYDVPLIVFHLEVNLETALLRNQSRTEQFQINPDTIRAIYDNFEPPSGDKGSCDKISFHIDCNVDRESMLSSVKGIVENSLPTAIANRLKQIDEEKEEQVRKGKEQYDSLMAAQTSVLQAIDLRLRRTVSSLMATMAQASIDKKDIKVLGQALGNAKNNAIASYKEEHLNSVEKENEKEVDPITQAESLCLALFRHTLLASCTETSGEYDLSHATKEVLIALLAEIDAKDLT